MLPEEILLWNEWCGERQRTGFGVGDNNLYCMTGQVYVVVHQDLVIALGQKKCVGMAVCSPLSG